MQCATYVGDSQSFAWGRCFRRSSPGPGRSFLTSTDGGGCARAPPRYS